MEVSYGIDAGENAAEVPSCVLQLFVIYKQLLFFEGKTSAAKPNKGMGMVKTCSPVAWSIYELLLGYKEPAVSALKLFGLDLVVAGLFEICKMLIHRISLEMHMYDILQWRLRAVNP